MEPIPEEKGIWGQTSKRINNNTPVVGDKEVHYMSTAYFSGKAVVAPNQPTRLENSTIPSSSVSANIAMHVLAGKETEINIWRK